VKLLKPGGQAAIVLPEGIFGNRSFGYVWDYIRSQGIITALIDCPRTTFQPSTDIKTNVLFFQKNPGAPESDGSSARVWMAVALSCGHDRRGKSTKNAGDAYPDDIKEIGSSFKTRHLKGGFWQLTKITDPYYLVPRYYDAVPLQELTREAKTLSANLMSLKHMVKQGFLRVRKGHEVGAESYGTGDVPFIRTSDISNYEVSIDPNRSVSEEVYEQYKPQQQLAPGDILIVVDGRYRIGRTAILNEHNYRCIVQSHIRIVSVTSGSPVNAIELLYLLNLPMVQHQIRNLIFIQSTLGALGSRLFEIQVPIPERVPSWAKTIDEFENLIRGRALLLQRLRAFEPEDYEI
jgi:type I restriction enzyme M protein